MSWRQISLLECGPDDAAARARLRIAKAMADAQQAHLEVTVFAPMPTPVAGTSLGLLSLGLQNLRNDWLREAERRADQVRALFPAQAEGVTVDVCKFLAGDLSASAAVIARTADLVIVAQPDALDGRMDSEVLIGALLSGGRPCLMIPQWTEPRGCGNRVVIAWKGTPEAARAVQGALPLLKSAGQVFLCIANPRSAQEGEDDRGMMRVAAYLQRHGVRVESPFVMKSSDSPEAQIAQAVQSFDADLLVMGAYSRPRLQEIIFGGMTAVMIRETKIPVCFAH